MTFQDLMGAGYTGDNKTIQHLYKKNKEHFDAILAQARKHAVIPLLGAGFSGSAYPGWTKLLREMAAPFPDCTSELETHLGNGEFEEAASVLRDEMGEHDFLSELYSRFGKHTLPDAMKQISDERKLLPRIFHGPLVTTNFEQVIEEIYGRGIPVLCPHTDYQAPQTQRTLQAATPILFKLHGTIEDRDHLILDKESYDAFYAPASGESVLVQTMKSIFASRQVLFLGCSLETDRVLQVLKSCCENREYFALAELPEETKNESDPFSPKLLNTDGSENAAYKKRRQFMSKHHINCIWYPYRQFDALDVFLKELCNNLDPPAKKTLSTIPAARRALIGRDAAIDEVYRRCTSGQTPVFVTGPGGIGKTEVCHSVLRRMQQEGYSVLYVDVTNVTTPAVFCEEVAKAAGAPALQDEKAGDLPYYLAYAKEQVIACPHGTLYLDNWESLWYAVQEEAIRLRLLEWMAEIRTAGIPVLVSSRDCPTEYDVPVSNHSLPALDRAKGEDRALFQAVYSEKGGHLSLKGEPFEELLRQLDGHPLSIVLTATQAARSARWENVLECWTQAKQKTANQRHSSLDAALRVSWDAVSDHPDCIRVWGLVALSREALPIAQLKALDPSWEEAQWEDSIARLHDASLLDWSDDGTALQMLQPIKEAFFLLAEENDALPCFLMWYDYFSIYLTLANDLHHKKRQEAHVIVVDQLSQAFHLLNRMLARNWQGLVSELILSLSFQMRNYFYFSVVQAVSLLDQLAVFAEHRENQRYSAYIMRHRADLLQRLGHTDDALDLYTKTENLYRQQRADLGLANTLQSRAELLKRLGQADDALGLYTQAENLYRKEQDDLGLANTLLSRADLLQRLGHTDDALNLYTQAENLYRQQRDDLGLANTLRSRADLLKRLGHIDDALNLYTQAEEFFRKERDNLGLANTLQSKADLLQRLGQADDALNLYTQVEELFRKERDNLGLANTLKSRGLLLYLIGQKADGIKNLQVALKLYESEQIPYSIARTCTVLSLVYTDSETHRAEAPAMERRAREIAEQLHPAERKDILNILDDTLEETP
ncbi:tetratricopeptide repeat protein [Pseudoflavonifractor phocaeensis]|uniref:tetratricopeptide repeat protein n=1 Tax=Pseudoflavonifractor phocaeensis TaxID=1870988 RepID=UPI0019595205|nr:tetratricopeptide repeat protein [Pseudoflavonifractor phocaeensis]MBM6870819.1 tetratricopeptide repeat protein [Pseudoflavonifractor phocaeensis]